MKWNGDQMKPKRLLRKLQMTAYETKLNQKLNRIKTNKSKTEICNRIINQNQNGIGIV